MSGLQHPERPPEIEPRRALPERPWRALMAIPVAVAAIVVGGMVSVVVAAIRSALSTPAPHEGGAVGVALHGPPPALTFTATLAQDLTLVAGAVLVAAAAMGGRLRAGALGLRPPRRALTAAGLVVGAYVLFLVVSAAWTSGLGITDRENVAIDLGTKDSAAGLVMALFLVSVVAPLAEELFFRGFLFGALRRRGLPLAAGVSGLAFGLAHVASSPIGFLVPLALLGVLLCLVYERTGSLYSAIALHAVNNAVAFGAADGRLWLIPVGLAAAAAATWLAARAVGEPRPAPARLV